MEAEPAPTFGDLLRRYRRAAGLTQEELSERAGLSVRGISDLERGVKTMPHRETIALLANALDLASGERALFEAARKRGPQRPDAPRTAEAHARPAGEGPALVGRASEVALLERHLAREGPPLLLLAGEPGIGKSRLLQEVAAPAVRAGWTVLWAGCQRGGDQEPYAPLLQALARYLQPQLPARLRVSLRGCAWLVRLLPELADGPIEPLPGWMLSPEQERRLMFEAVGRFLANVAGPAGTLLVLDDLQWAGQDGLDLLVTLARSAGESAVRVIGAYRDTEVQPADALSVALADLAHAGLAAQRSLAPLAPDEAARLLDDLLPHDGTGSAALRERVLQRTGGVPFFVLSCAQALRLDNRADGDVDAVPWDVAQGIRQRVAALPGGAQEVLGVAAMLGRAIEPELLSAVGEQPERAVLGALDAARQARLLVDNGSVYQFAHDLIREVVEADVGVARRRALHRRVAEVLEQQLGDLSVELLAYHYGHAGLPEKALVYLEQAGDRAWARHANAAAQGYYREMAERLDQLGHDQDAACAREKLGLVLRTLARYDEALAVLDRAADTFRVAGDVESYGRTLAQMGRVYGVRGTPSEGIDCLQPVQAQLEARGPSQGLAALCSSLAELFHFAGRYSEQLIAARRAVEVAETLGDERTLAYAGYMHGLALLFLGQAEDGLRVLEEARARAEVIGDLSTLCEVLDPLGYTYTARGDFARSKAHWERAVTVAERSGDLGWIANMTAHRGIPALYLGHWDQARADLERGVALSRQVGPSMALMFTLGYRGQLRLWAGEWAEATQDLEEVSTLVERAGTRDMLREAQTLLAERDLLQGHPAAACARLVPLLDRSGVEELHVTRLLPALAWAHLELGDVAAAADVARQAVRRAKAQVQRRTLVDALRVQAMVAIRQAHWEEAANTLEEGLALARDMTYPYAEGRLLYVYGQMYAAKGAPALARKRLEVALAIFRRLGARKDIERVEHTIAGLSGLGGIAGPIVKHPSDSYA